MQHGNNKQTNETQTICNNDVERTCQGCMPFNEHITDTSVPRRHDDKEANEQSAIQWNQ